MQSVGAFDAKMHLSTLLNRAAEGETIVITKRGGPVAKIGPPNGPEPADPRKAVQEIRQLLKGVHLGGLSIRWLIQEGRRF